MSYPPLGVESIVGCTKNPNGTWEFEMFILWRPTAYDSFRNGTLNFVVAEKVFWSPGFRFRLENRIAGEDPARFGI